MQNIDINIDATEASPQELLHKYIDEMDDFQIRLVLSFIKTLFNLSD